MHVLPLDVETRLPTAGVEACRARGMGLLRLPSSSKVERSRHVSLLSDFLCLLNLDGNINKMQFWGLRKGLSDGKYIYLDPKEKKLHFDGRAVNEAR